MPKRDIYNVFRVWAGVSLLSPSYLSTIVLYIITTSTEDGRSAKRSSFYSSQHSTQKVKISLSIFRNLAFIVKIAGMGVGGYTYIYIMYIYIPRTVLTCLTSI